MKIHCIIQARFGSTRLPGKVMEKIGPGECGITLLHMVIDRCCKSLACEKVIVAGHGILDITNAGPDTAEIYLVEGPEEPAARFVKVLAEHPCDGFVRVCADSPFINYCSVSLAAEQLRYGKDYALRSSTGINGDQAEGFNTQAFLNAEPSMQCDEREHLGLWFQRRDRLTVDTPGDLERARLIVSRMTKPHTEYTAAECLELLRK